MVPSAGAATQTMRNVVGCLPARQFNALLEDHYGAGAIHVVVSIKQDTLVVFNGPAQAGHGGVHLGQQPGIVEIGQRGLEETAGLLRLSKTSRPQDAGGRGG